jgi:DNA-binding TFAR19-related protein (PDSD5 family)
MRLSEADGNSTMDVKRAVLRIQLDPSAKQQLDRLAKTRGMTQISIMSRLVEWFVRQNEVIQLAVLGVVSEEFTGPLAKRLLERIAEEAPADSEAAFKR